MAMTGVGCGYRQGVTRKFYADAPVRRLVQILFDLLLLAIAALAWWLGSRMSDGVLKARDGARSLGSGAGGLSNNLTSTADTLRGLPFVGDKAAAPLQEAASSARDLSQSGNDLADGLQLTANLLLPAIGLAGTSIMLLLWLMTRGRFVRKASRVAQLSDFPEGQKILALEAKMSLPVKQWRGRSEEEIVGMLRHSVGLRRQIRNGRPQGEPGSAEAVRPGERMPWQ